MCSYDTFKILYTSSKLDHIPCLVVQLVDLLWNQPQSHSDGSSVWTQVDIHLNMSITFMVPVDPNFSRTWLHTWTSRLSNHSLLSCNASSNFKGLLELQRIIIEPVDSGFSKGLQSTAYHLIIQLHIFQGSSGSNHLKLLFLFFSLSHKFMNILHQYCL